LSRRLLGPLALLLGALTLLLHPVAVQAAEVLQVRSGTLLQVGDHNRTYTVELACLTIPAGGDAAAAERLRLELPRRTRINLRPMGNHNGTLVARVQPLQRGEPGGDLSEGLIAAGLASPTANCG
jgi:hypothetical protein